MNNAQLFTAAKGILGSGEVPEVEFEGNSKRRQGLHIRIDFHPGAQFSCTKVDYGERYRPVHDTKQKTLCHIPAQAPLIVCSNHEAHLVDADSGKWAWWPAVKGS